MLMFNHPSHELKISTILDGLKVGDNTPKNGRPCFLINPRSLIHHVRQNVHRDVDIAKMLEEWQQDIDQRQSEVQQSGYGSREFLPRRLKQLADEVDQWIELLSDDHARIGYLVADAVRFLVANDASLDEIIADAGFDHDEFCKTRSILQRLPSADDSVITTIHALGTTRDITWSQMMTEHPVEYLICMRDYDEVTERSLGQFVEVTREPVWKALQRFVEEVSNTNRKHP